MPAFNAAAWIGQTLDSALSQTWRELELIVVDDGSTDETAAVVKSVCDPRVRMVCQSNRGAAAARNKGLAAATGAFIQFLDADDLLSPDKIARQMCALRQALVGSVASCAWGHFASDPRDAVVRPEPVWQIGDTVGWLTCSLSGGGMMPTEAWLAPRSLIEAAGPWDEALTVHDDGEFFTRVLLKATRNIFVPGATVYYRQVAGSLSRRPSRKAVESALAVCRSGHRHLLAAADSPAVRRALATQYAQFAYEFGVQAPDLMCEALEAIRELRVAPASAIGGRSFRRLTCALGISLALRVRASVLKLRTLGQRATGY